MSRFKIAAGLVVIAGVAIAIATEFVVPHLRWRELTNAGRLALDHSRSSEAEKSFREALKIARTFPKDERRIAQSALNLAEALLARGQDADAEPLAKEALRAHGRKTRRR